MPRHRRPLTASWRILETAAIEAVAERRSASDGVRVLNLPKFCEPGSSFRQGQRIEIHRDAWYDIMSYQR